MLSSGARSREGAEQGASRELLVYRGWKFFGDAHLNISDTFPTAVVAVEDINPVDGKCLAEVQCKPRVTVILCVTNFASVCDPINTVGSNKKRF